MFFSFHRIYDCILNETVSGTILRKKIWYKSIRNVCFPPYVTMPQTEIFVLLNLKRITVKNIKFYNYMKLLKFNPTGLIIILNINLMNRKHENVYSFSNYLKKTTFKNKCTNHPNLRWKTICMLNSVSGCVVNFLKEVETPKIFL